MKLENLFKWNRGLVITDPNGEEFIPEGSDEPLTLYQRIVGDAELQEARKQAFRASRALRLRLKDEDSMEYAMLIPEYDDMDDEALRNAIVITEAGDIRDLADENAQKPKYPAELPTDASLEAREEYQHEMDTYDERVDEAVAAQVTVEIQKRLKQLQGMKREKLIKIFSRSVINNLASREMIDVFNSWCAYLGTYEDEEMTKRAFDTYELFDNTSPELKGQVIAGYASLEMSGRELKKLD